MNDKQRAKLAMFQTTLLVLSEHAADYAANKALVARLLSNILVRLCKVSHCNSI